MSALQQLRLQGILPRIMTDDSRSVGPGSLFLACPGEHRDGRDFIPQALAQGAAAVLWERENFEWHGDWHTPNLAVQGLHQQAGVIASEFYQHPSQHLWMIGVTGTNGKTSCCHWLSQALTMLGRKTAVVGTLGNGFPGKLVGTSNTTPNPILLQGMLAEYLQQDATAVAMEVSSHGLAQGRVNGVQFDVAMFTNLSRDHLDYHGDMGAYGNAKKLLFRQPGLGCAVLNADEEFGISMAAELVNCDTRVLTYGLQAGDVRASDLVLTNDGLSMNVETPDGHAELHSNLLGRFNASNLLAVLATLLASGARLTAAVTVLGNLAPVAGRMQRLGGGKHPLVVVDYAHTPDALEKVLTALREQTGGRLICVFGCGGNRDQGKRPLMGDVASRLADTVVVTSDNPRHENPSTIIAAIVDGMNGNYHIEADRAAAIAQAIAQAKTGDVVLLAGKGHETYQEIDGVKLPFSDLDVAQRALGAWA